MNLPPHAYVPGQTPRHDPSAFTDLHSSVWPGMSVTDLSNCAAWQAGWLFFKQGYFWEAHEVLEPVWMQTAPNSVERHFVQALIQIANAALKLRMDRPRAVLRLCDVAAVHLDACGKRHRVMGLHLTELRDQIELLRGEISQRYAL